MSFAQEVKDELSLIESNECCKKAELSAFLRFNTDVSIVGLGFSLIFQSSHQKVVKKFINLIKSYEGTQLEYLTKRSNKLDRKLMYVVKVYNVSNIVTEFDLFGDPTEKFLKNDCCKQSYIRTTFLSNGSVNSPNSSYHFEITSSDEDELEFVNSLLHRVGFNSKIIERRKKFVLYIKEAEKIEEIFILMGAVNSMFSFADVRISRDVFNSINRLINCEIANEKKSIDAANSQLEHIKFLESIDSLELKTSMKEVIKLRKTFPEASLIELSEESENVIGKNLSKSALNHRFRAIKKLYNELKENA